MRRPLTGLGLLAVLVSLVFVTTVTAARPERAAPASGTVREGQQSATPTVRRGQGGTAGSAVSGTKAQWVIDENAKPGDPGWGLGPGSHGGSIEGYADRVSAQRGDTVNVAVSTSEPRYHLEAFRIGYYGGAGARRVWQSPVMQGAKQADCPRDPKTNTVECRWNPSVRVRLDDAWPPGAYLLKLKGENDGPERFVPLTVRDDASRAAFLIMSAVTTWQAYNDYGGYSLYGGPGGDFTRRARVVSFDRPYNLGAGSGDFLGNEEPLIRHMEQQGLDVAYWTDIDLHQRPNQVVAHKALLSLGHDEYWTARMRAGAEAARDKGVNLAFFGANAIFRQIRLDASPAGPDRRQVGYKSASEDPLRRKDDGVVTVDWRAPPVNKPESSLIGQQYECNPVKADMVIADAAAWVFAGTGLRSGDKLRNLVGSEYDRYNPRDPQPPGSQVQVLAHSPVRCHADSSYADMTYYAAPSGAGVFATGTNLWVNNLSPPCPSGCLHDPMVVKVTENVLQAFGTGPAGRAFPSRANYAGLPQAPAPRPTVTTRRPVTTAPAQPRATSPPQTVTPADDRPRPSVPDRPRPSR